MNMLLSAGTVVYVGSIFALAVFAKNNVRNEADFLVSGRKLSTFFASTTLFATWFGAGTLLTATDAIYNHGLAITALEPFGAGSCLLIAGLFFARPLWQLQILTVPDLFALKFGKTAELVSAILLIPGYFGWIAVQITALAGIIHLFFGLPVMVGMIVVTTFAITLACLGGMWSVVLTDSVQMVFVGVVIIVLAVVVIKALGHGQFAAGVYRFAQEARFQDEWLTLKGSSAKLFSFINVFAIAALGNLPGQDLAQRIFSAKSAPVARRSCLIAGGFYVVLGSISIILGISAKSLLPAGVTNSVIPHLALNVLPPGLTILLVLSIISIILSTMDSAMLATSSIISHNLIKGVTNTTKRLLVCRICIVFVGLLSLLLAFVGDNVYKLLEQSYAISLVGIFAPFLLGLYLKRGHELAAILSMITGISLWLLGFFIDGFFLSEIGALVASFIAYGIFAFMLPHPKEAGQKIT